MLNTLPLLFAMLAATTAAENVPPRQLIEEVSPERLFEWHDMVASIPHMAGTPGDEKVVNALVDAFTKMGLEVEAHPIWTYLAYPVSAELEIVSPERKSLPVKEQSVKDDDHPNDEGQTIGFNAYSGSGEATGEIVYANRGTKEDFERLEKLGVEVEGRIVIARYGGNFRGYKAKFAEAAGAIGLIIYTDPDDSGYRQGLPWPEGGFANESYIQRGSIMTLDYSGDPLTPFREASENAERLDPAEVALPTIPVQPVSWSAAHEIMQHMKGPEVPNDWQGGLPFRYRLTGGSDLSVRLNVQQIREIRKTHNVVATLRGSEEPDRFVVLGGHHDSWSHGAVDPTAGLITILETAQLMSDLARQGERPRRSVRFAAWGAEEYGIIGSVEWVESRLEEIVENAVAYLNLDGSAMGPQFWSSSSPSLQPVIKRAADSVQALGGDGTVLDDWMTRSPSEDWPSFGDLGGGSDHVGFLALGGVPAAGLGGRGARGVSYHSLYDHLDWYRRVVDDSYSSATMVTRVLAQATWMLADDPLLPLGPDRLDADILRHLGTLSDRGRALGKFAAGEGVVAELEPVALAARALTPTLEEFRKSADQVSDSASLGEINGKIMALDRVWLDDEGLPGRPWFRNLYAAPDEDSGYASWMLPGLRYVVEKGDDDELTAMVERYVAILERIGSEIQAVNQLLTTGP
ncbi:MAG: M28 family peptidase [Acidobacteriota bacterium]